MRKWNLHSFLKNCIIAERFLTITFKANLKRVIRMDISTYFMRHWVYENSIMMKKEMPATSSITLYHFLSFNTKVLHFRNGGRNAKSLIVPSLRYQCVPTSWKINRSLLRDPHNRERGAITPGPKVTGCMDVNTSLVWGVWVGVQFTVGRWHQPIIAVTILTVHSLSCSASVCDERNHHTPSDSQTITRSCPARRHTRGNKRPSLHLK